MGVGEALIRSTDVEIHQQELCVLNDVNLELHKGEFVYLVGKVGSGKTRLLKTFYGELDIASGEAEVCLLYTSWKMFRNGMIEHYGLYLNLETMKVNQDYI